MVVTTGEGARSSLGASALDELSVSQDELDRMGEALAKRMTELHETQEVFEKAVKKQAKKLKTVTTDAARTDEHMTNGTTVTPNGAAPLVDAAASVPSLPRDRASAAGEARTCETRAIPDETEHGDAVRDLQTRLRKNELLMPATGGMFVEMFLGSINVRFERKSERINFKKEYEKLKLKLAPVFVVMCLVCLFFAEFRWFHMILQMALACYYVTLAVRENILRANGSNIRAWWIIHHYFTMMQGVLLLTWPDGASYARYRRLLHLFGLYNATLMIFQTRYQMARLYTLRSLGMAHEMDVASSDSTQIHWSETMTLLLPLIVLGQMMQGYQAMYLFLVYREFPSQAQILMLSLLFLANFIGNSTTTIQVLLAKRAERRRKTSVARTRAKEE